MNNRTVQAPTTEPDSYGGTKHTHPAFGVIAAHRVSGNAALFGSDVGHSGFVKIEVSQATMTRDGYSERIHGSARDIVEVWLSEAQWVAFVSRMNVGSGTPCTIRHYGTKDSMVCCPELPDPELAAERMDGRITELEAGRLATIRAQSAVIDELCAALPAKKRDAILSAVSRMTQHLEANHEFAAKTLREYKETLVTESKVEIDAMITSAVQSLGLESVQQLGALLAADPRKAMQLLTDESNAED